jgi:hypothetical protein
MKKTKFSESQIVAILQEGEAGLPVADPQEVDQLRHVLQLEVEVRWRVGGRFKRLKAPGRER